MVKSNYAERAKKLALHYHRDQVDKLGRPYRVHLARVAYVAERVAFSFGLDDERIDYITALAWLHDCFEDTDVT